jgi:hypothetical protein
MLIAARTALEDVFDLENGSPLVQTEGPAFGIVAS